MPKSKSKEKKHKAVSMREAFDKVGPKAKDKKRHMVKKEFPIRSFFWNYPESISKFLKLTSPLSTILIFCIVGFGLFSFLRSNILAERISSRESSTYVEGRIGAISTFNPLFSNQNDVDKAIQNLVFEKFINIDSNGNILPGIANNWDISENSKVYQFNINLDHKWSDGLPLTIDDVYFTFDTAIKLSLEHNYDTVASGFSAVKIEVLDEDSIKFTLPQTNVIFPELASIYIVPEHILQDVSLSQMPFDRFSRNPIGSGPYKVYRSEPNIVSLQASEYFTPKPNISSMVIRIYSEITGLESAFRNGLLDAVLLPNNESASFVEEYASYNINIVDLSYRERVLFFNLRKEKFQSNALRKGITLLIDKEKLLEESGINGKVADGPICDCNWAFSTDVEYLKYDPEKAKETLKEAGYTKNESNGYFETEDSKLLTFTVSYLKNSTNDDLLNRLALMLVDEGIIMNLEPLTYSQLTQEILATRNFEVLMYEIEVTVDPDQYNLWHSLQKDYPNLNLSGYEFSRIDILLEEGRREIERSERKKDYSLFQKYLVNDVPAIFLYRPSYLFVVRDSVKGIEYGDIVRLENIYDTVYEWRM